MSEEREPTLTEASAALRSALRAVFWEPIEPYFVRYCEAMAGNHGMFWVAVTWFVWMVSAFAVVFWVLLGIYATLQG